MVYRRSAHRRALALEPGMLVQIQIRGTERSPEVVTEIPGGARVTRGDAADRLSAAANYLGRLLTSTDPATLEVQGHPSTGLDRQADRLLVLGGEYPDFDSVPLNLTRRLAKTRERLTRIEEEQRLPRWCSSRSRRRREPLASI
ncbi:MAG: hypothetical protein R3A46_15520 [Thermomicrobiales bacterium]